MKHSEQNITFELNENLSFETGQEIEEMISISIDPDIVIQAYEKHIQIRGIILLAGEYHRRHGNEERTHATHRQSVNRYIEKVINLDDDVAGFSHRFPVEIAVAKERIENIEDVVVTVDSFDYELPSANILNIMASLHIHGIIPERKVKSGFDVTMMDENKPSQTTEKDVEKERKQSTYQKQNEENERAKTTSVIQDTLNENNKNEQDVEKTVAAREETEKHRSLKLIKSDTNTNSKDSSGQEDTVERKQKNIDSTRAIAQKLDSSKHSQTSQNEKVVEGSDTHTAQNVGNTDTNEQEKYEKMSDQSSEVQTEVDTNPVHDEIDAISVSTQDENHHSMAADPEHEMQIGLSESVEDDETEVKDVTFLTELFEEEEETYTQVTIYIAQDEDSIESIAKRYEIPVLQLLKDNNLSADTIETGQLITIRQRSMS